MHSNPIDDPESAGNGDSSGLRQGNGDPLPDAYRGSGRTMPSGYRGTDYRGTDYRTSYRGTDYRGMDYRNDQPSENSVDLVAALWRYRWFVLLPLLLGTAGGYAYYTTEPIVYRSSTKLLIESDVPTVLDSATGDIVSGLPSSDMMLAQLKSDTVLREAAENPLMQNVMQDESATSGSIAAELARSLKFEPDASGSGAMSFLLHVDNEDPQFAEAGVESLSKSLENYYVAKTQNTIGELKLLIEKAKGELLPEVERLEAAYEAFRAEQPDLAWDGSGNLINRFRDTEVSLIESRSRLQTERADLEIKLAAIISTAKDQQDDPILVMKIVGHLMGTPLEATLEREASDPAARPSMVVDPIVDDVRLARLAIERQLVPLQVKRDNLAATFAPAHPSVVQLDRQIESTRAKLQDLIAQEDARRLEIKSDLPVEEIKQPKTPEEFQAEREERARTVVNTFVRGLRTRSSVLDSQIQELNKQIEEAREGAAQLADAERLDAVHREKIGRSQRLLSQVEEQMARINVTESGTNIRVESLSAPTGAYRIAPVMLKTVAIGTFLGGLVGCGFVYTLESFSKTFRSGDEIAQLLELPVLGQIPVHTTKAPRDAKKPDYKYRDIDYGLTTIHRPRSMSSEAIRRIRTSLYFEAAQSGAKVIQVTSPVPEDGKSTVSGNLAASIANSGKSVVLVDADLRRPQTSENFSLSNKDGVTELLNGQAVPSDIIYKTAYENLSVVPSGTIPGNPAEALALPEFGELMHWLRERYDYVIIDTPPLLVVADPSIVSGVVDGVIFTFRIKRGCRPKAKEAAAMLRANQVNLIGCVVNQVDERKNSKYKVSEAGSYYYKKYQKGIGKSHHRKGKKDGYEVRKDAGGRMSEWLERTDDASFSTAAEGAEGVLNGKSSTHG